MFSPSQTTLRWSLLLLALGGCPGPEERTCDEVCDSLVDECGFAAFPDRDSCMQGCYTETANGSSATELSSCFYEASCDIFEVVACAQQHEVAP